MPTNAAVTKTEGFEEKWRGIQGGLLSQILSVFGGGLWRNQTQQISFLCVWDEPPLKEPVKVSCYHLKHIPAP